MRKGSATVGYMSKNKDNTKDKPKRKYFRKCGVCDVKAQQSKLIRVSPQISPNGWICADCLEEIESEPLFDDMD